MRDLNKEEEVISKAFKECSEFMVPSPGSKITKGSVGEGVTLRGMIKVLVKPLFIVSYLTASNSRQNVCCSTGK